MPVELYELKTKPVKAIQYKMGSKCYNKEDVVQFLGPMFDPVLSLDSIIHFKNKRGRYNVVMTDEYVLEHPVLGRKVMDPQIFESLYQLVPCHLQVVHTNNN